MNSHDETIETRLVFVRHGESQVTVDQIVGGPKACVGLSALGHRQAQALRDRFATGHEVEVDTLWSSTMPRAIETANHVNEALGLTLQQDQELEEWRPGDADGLPWSEVRERWPDAGSSTDPFESWAPGAESLRDLHHRAGKAISTLARTHRGKSVLVVVHAGVIDVALRLLLGLSPAGGFHLWTRNTSLTEFVLREPTDGAVAQPLWQMVRYNDAAHIAGLD